MEKIKFLLEDEIDYVIEGLSVNLHDITQIKCKHDDRLPDSVIGDLSTLRLAFVSLIEYGMKHCQQGEIQLQTRHEGFQKTSNKTIMFGFSVILECNSQHNEQILFKMITRKSTHG
jgi:hypothetical protein